MGAFHQHCGHGHRCLPGPVSPSGHADRKSGSTFRSASRLVDEAGGCPNNSRCYLLNCDGRSYLATQMASVDSRGGGWSTVGNGLRGLTRRTVVGAKAAGRRNGRRRSPDWTRSASPGRNTATQRPCRTGNGRAFERKGRFDSAVEDICAESQRPAPVAHHDHSASTVDSPRRRDGCCCHARNQC
jgi:hypothetical protein